MMAASPRTANAPRTIAAIVPPPSLPLAGMLAPSVALIADAAAVAAVSSGSFPSSPRAFACVLVPFGALGAAAGCAAVVCAVLLDCWVRNWLRLVGSRLVDEGEEEEEEDDDDEEEEEEEEEVIFVVVVVVVVEDVVLTVLIVVVVVVAVVAVVDMILQHVNGWPLFKTPHPPSTLAHL